VNISGGVYEQIKNKLVVGYQSLGDEKLKNITDPVRIYRVLPDPAAVRTYSRRNLWLSSTAAAALFLLLAGGAAYFVAREQSRMEAAAGAPALVSAQQVPGRAAAPVPVPAPPPQAPPPAEPRTQVAAVPNAVAPTAPMPLTSTPAPKEDRDCQGCPEMVNIPGGTFTMGSNDDPSEKPVRTIRVGEFSMSRYPVTVKEWRQCHAANVCKFEPVAMDDEPMRNVSFNDAQEYVTWLTAAAGQPYRLPSEVEWEYAAKAGSTNRYPWGRQMVAGLANCKACGGPPELVPVGRFAPNNWGLHDMVGSVAQWTQDCWHKDYTGAPKDQSARDSRNCQQRVLRGGSWMSSDPLDVRVTNRAYYDVGVRYPAHGFRVVRPIKTGG
jgi:formylglycine-generating enzyme required for sulfatase activity